MQAGIAQRAAADRQVGAAFEQGDDAVVAGQFQLHLGIARAVADVRHDRVRHERRRRIHPQPSGRTLAARGASAPRGEATGMRCTQLCWRRRTARGNIR
jgi:hypothetical protein